MDEDKKKRLEAKGWRVAGAADLLGLTPKEAAFIENRLRPADGASLARTPTAEAKPRHLTSRARHRPEG